MSNSWLWRLVRSLCSKSSRSSPITGNINGCIDPSFHHTWGAPSPQLGGYRCNSVITRQSQNHGILTSEISAYDGNQTGLRSFRLWSMERRQGHHMSRIFCPQDMSRSDQCKCSTVQLRLHRSSSEFGQELIIPSLSTSFGSIQRRSSHSLASVTLDPEGERSTRPVGVRDDAVMISKLISAFHAERPEILSDHPRAIDILRQIAFRWAAEGSSGKGEEGKVNVGSTLSELLNSLQNK